MSITNKPCFSIKIESRSEKLVDVSFSTLKGSTSTPTVVMFQLQAISNNSFNHPDEFFVRKFKSLLKH